jgi:hypothetical protein
MWRGKNHGVVSLVEFRPTMLWIFGDDIPGNRKALTKVFVFLYRSSVNWVGASCRVAGMRLVYFPCGYVFDVIGEVLRHKSWLSETLGAKNGGKLIVLGCFFALMTVHSGQAAICGIFLHRTRLLRSVGVNSTARMSEVPMSMARWTLRPLSRFAGKPLPGNDWRRP